MKLLGSNVALVHKELLLLLQDEALEVSLELRPQRQRRLSPQLLFCFFSLRWWTRCWTTWRRRWRRWSPGPTAPTPR